MPHYSVRDVQNLVGSQSYHRGDQYERNGRVLPVSANASRLLARCRGSRGRVYEQVIHLVPLDASCSCPMMFDCKHVAAALLHFHRHPEKWPKTPDIESLPTVEDPPHTPKAFERWANEMGVPHCADLPAHSALGRPDVDWQWWYRVRNMRLPDILAKHGANPAVKQLLSLAKQAAIGVARARQLEELAEEWRAQPPAAPLRELWETCRRHRHPELVGQATQEWQRVHLNEESATLDLYQFARDWGDKATLPLDHTDAHLESLRPLHARSIATTILDVLTSPANAEFRDELATFLAVPAWQRTLNAIESVLPREPTEPTLIGWRVKQRRGELDVVLVRCEPYKRRSGFKTAKLNPYDVHLGPLDRGAAAAIDTTDVLEQLTGHPRVVDAKGNLLTVTRHDAALAAVESEDGFEVRLQLGSETVPIASALHALRMNRSGVLYDEEARRIRVFSVPPHASSLLSRFANRQTRFPQEAIGPLSAFLLKLEPHIPLVLDGVLRGTKVEPDLRPIVRMQALGETGLRVDLLVRPLTGGPLFTPGEGPPQVARVRDGAREYVQRDPLSEAEAVRAALADVPLPDEGWGHIIEELDDALALVHALEDRSDLRVEWPQDRHRVTGTLQASELNVRARSGRDWFGIEGGVGKGANAVSLADLLAAVQGGKRFVQVKGRRWARISEQLRGELELAARIARQDDNAFGLPPLAAVGVLAGLASSGASVTMPKKLKDLEQNIRDAEDLEIATPPDLNATLRAYQRDGFAWLVRMAHWAPGACLADDMGLGKTLQALALLLHRRDEGPALVVAPASVNLNWLREAHRFTPTLRTRSYRGADRASLLEQLGAGDVLVTSYELMLRDAEALAECGFATVVYDEAQALKNPASKRARASAALGAGFVLALSGTPVENRVGELWSLFRTVAPGLLGPMKHFRDRFATPISKDNDRSARTSLARVVQPFILRRTKQQVATELPDRIESVVPIELSPSERERYDTFRLAAAQAATGEEDRMKLLAALTRLRQLACARRLLDPDAPARSSKIDRLVELLHEVRESGAQALVFSQFTTLLGLVRDALDAEGISYQYLDGSIPVAKRQVSIDAFQEGQGDAFLISLRAGGTGLNLTAASYVFHLDPWWNPAVEDQATDRAHRIGQTNTVSVYRLVSTDTIEEQVLEMHAHKRDLASSLLSGTSRAAGMTAERLIALLTGKPLPMEEPAVAEPAPRPRPKVEPVAAEPAVDAIPAPTVATEPSVDPTPEVEPAPQTSISTHADLLAAFDTLMEAESVKASTVRNYRRAVVNLCTFAEAHGTVLSTVQQVDVWQQNYLAAIESGAVQRARSDRVFGPPAYRRLHRVLPA